MSTDVENAGTETQGTETDKVNTGALGTLVAVGLFAMISICAAVTALVRHDVETEQAEKDADSNQTVIELKAEQRGMLNGPAAYVDRGKGLVSLPIETAKQLVVSELERDPNSATPAPPKDADAGVTAAASADAGTSPATADDSVLKKEPKKTEETGKNDGAQKAAGAKPDSGKEHGTTASTPAPSAKPASPPLSPTAASPGALAPGPIKN